MPLDNNAKRHNVLGMTRPDIEAIGGPYDGSLMPWYHEVFVVRLFEASPVLHTYERVREDDGTYFYVYRGAHIPQAA